MNQVKSKNMIIQEASEMYVEYCHCPYFHKIYNYYLFIPIVHVRREQNSFVAVKGKALKTVNGQTRFSPEEKKGLETPAIALSSFGLHAIVSDFEYFAKPYRD
ncbi:hypothetical protein AVEN_218124-1 [Araneus ventricosus]|uniref:Uncharacterized protein n=1 Tax=Araneus ventricosus TaxID=182803 RepID=A0A4Y2I420_ARAVE|nr:hypothetical protein AVEN_218124-1 [Araneus ventricosus]